MIPNQKDGKPGQYLKPSMLISMAAARAPTGRGRQADGLLPDRRERQRHPPDRARRDGRRQHPRAHHGKLSDTEKKIIEYLDVVATHVGPLPPPPPKSAGELDRALAPAWESVAFKKVDVKHAAKEYYENAKAVLERA